MATHGTTRTAFSIALVGCVSVTAEACSQRIATTTSPRPLPVDRSMMCDHGPVRARVPTRRVGTELPPKGSPARAIQRAVCDEYDELGACYGDALWRDSAQTGLVTARFVILEGGRVGEVCFLDTAINDREMLECIRERFFQIEIPGFVERKTVVYPIEYKPRSSDTSASEGTAGLCERLRREDAE